MTEHLSEHITYSNGRRKTVCTSAVIAYFDISPKEYHYSQNIGDIARILRSKGYHVRSRRSRFPFLCTVGKLRKKIEKLNEGCMYYVKVKGHAMLLDSTGKTVIDTDPRKRDKRQVYKVHAIFPKKGKSK